MSRKTHTCKRCCYQWVPRFDVVRMCPSCKSKYWDQSRRDQQGRRSDLEGSLRKHVDTAMLLRLTTPIIQALYVEGRKHVAQASPGTIAKLAVTLESVLKQLTRPSGQFDRTFGFSPTVRSLRSAAALRKPRIGDDVTGVGGAE